MAQKALNLDYEEGRNRGRPRKRWKDNVNIWYRGNKSVTMQGRVGRNSPRQTKLKKNSRERFWEPVACYNQ